LIVIDLADVDESRAPLVFIPPPENLQAPTNLALLSPNASALSYLCAAQTPRKKWVVLRGERGSIIALPHDSDHSAIWTYPADIHNKPRTSIMIDLCAFQHGDTTPAAQNCMLKWNFDRLTDLQKMFAYPTFFEEPISGLAKVS
jgi:hypothetical protein